MNCLNERVDISYICFYVYFYSIMWTGKENWIEKTFSFFLDYTSSYIISKNQIQNILYKYSRKGSSQFLTCFLSWIYIWIHTKLFNLCKAREFQFNSNFRRNHVKIKIIEEIGRTSKTISQIKNFFFNMNLN